MKKNKENVLLELACHKLFSSNKNDEIKMLTWLQENGDDVSFEVVDHYPLLVFSYPVKLLEDDVESDEIERIIVLVFDEKDIIADCNAFHFKASLSLTSQDILDYLSVDDWSYCQTFVLRQALEKEETLNGEALLMSNLYVTKAYRNHGLMNAMLDAVKEHCLRYIPNNTDLHIIFSLDPDIPCYGPDSSDEPYYYSMEKDEPIRQKNQAILKHLGFHIIRLTNDDNSITSDGTKTYFAYRHEIVTIVEATQVVA